MSLAIKQLVNPDYGTSFEANVMKYFLYLLGLFVTTDSDEVSYTINPKTPANLQTLKLYEFAGKIIGKAIFERITLDIHFDRCTLAAIAHQKPTLKELKSLDTGVRHFLLFTMMILIKF